MKRKIVMMLVLALSTGMFLTGCSKEAEEKRRTEEGGTDRGKRREKRRTEVHWN